MNCDGVPLSVITGLHRYVNQRVETGDFLRAVLENNLCEAFAFADDKNLPKLHIIVKYVYNELPGLCWGSKEKVQKWLARKENSHLCTICHKNYVDSDNGFDTCQECLRRR